MAPKVSRAGKCKLCGSHGVLQESHVIPRLVRKGMRGTGAVEDPKYYMAQGGEFNKLEQDLPKKYWLCRGCEEILSDSEKPFAEAVYQPLWSRRIQSGRINDDHIHRFLVSVAWRAWHWYDEDKNNPFSNFSNQDRLREVEEVWRTYLLGNRDKRRTIQAAYARAERAYGIPFWAYGRLEWLLLVTWYRSRPRRDPKNDTHGTCQNPEDSDVRHSGTQEKWILAWDPRWSLD